MTTQPNSGHDGPYDAPLCIAKGKVLPEWIDYNGHMNAAFYGLTFQHEAENFLEDTVGFGKSFVAAGAAGPFVLQNHIHYIAELEQDEPFRIEVILLDHDAKRMHMFFMMISEQSGKLCATAEYVNMNVNLAERRGQAFPDWLKARLETMQSSHDRLDRPQQVGAAIGLRRK